MTIQMLERSRRAQKEIEEMSCDLVELGKGFDAVTAVYGKTAVGGHGLTLTTAEPGSISQTSPSKPSSSVLRRYSLTMYDSQPTGG